MPILVRVCLAAMVFLAPARGATVDAPLPRLDAASQQSAANSVEHLRAVMDQFHDRFPVYDDVSSAGNHFHAWAKIPDESAAVSISGSSTESTHSGATAIRAEFRNTTGLNFGGFYFLNGVLPPEASAPLPNFGELPDAGVDLSGATALSFWARGVTGNERVEFFMGGVGRDPGTGQPIAPFPGSTTVVKRTVSLTQHWRRYSIDLAGTNLSYVLGGFGWVASAPANPTGAVFFIDDIEYELDPQAREARLNEPRFLKSFVTAPVQSLPPPVGDFDFVFRNAATIYDNALALLAFLADGSADSLRRAHLIGDAFVYAKDHDRSYCDRDRVRDVYAAGDIALPPGWTPNGLEGTVPIPGFFDEESQNFIEIEQDGISTGNNAWVIIALLALHERTGHDGYRVAAEEIGRFVQSFKNETGLYQGFTGGLDDPEGSPQMRPWASTEHNLDVFAAFAGLHALTGEPQWQQDAMHALRFIEAMWEEERGCNLAGTLDPETRNQLAGQLPSDTQSWSVLAAPSVLGLHPELLDCAERNHRSLDQGFSGFDFNEDRDAVWFEGTAHLATAYASIGREGKAEALRAELRRAQETSPFGDGEGVAAASQDGLTTGFGFFFFRRLHVGATAWNIFAQQRFNPFTAEPIPGQPCSADAEVLCLLGDRFRIEIDWLRPNGTSGKGQAVPFTDRAGLFYFFNEANLEMLIKMINACSFNNRFWIFYAATTNVEFTVTVTDTKTGMRNEYFNPLGQAAFPIQDTSAFATCP